MTTETVEKQTKKKQIPWNRKVSPNKLKHLLSINKLNPSQAAKVIGVTPEAIYQSLQKYKIDVSAFDIEAVKTQHESELIAINALARGRIFDKLLNDHNLGLIEITATLDRTFQQLRELQGKGHSSINIFTLIVQKADENILNVPAKVVDNQQVVQQATDGTSSGVSNEQIR